jgi:hypothetical protein
MTWLVMQDAKGQTAISFAFFIGSVHPETGDFQMLSDLAPGSVRSDARQIHFSGALANQISAN